MPTATPPSQSTSARASADNLRECKRGSQAVDRTLSLLTKLIDPSRGLGLRAAAEELGIAPSTSHRLVARLEAHGLLVRTGPGRYRPGVIFAAANADILEILSVHARPVLRRLARDTGRTAHLGILESDMVTYVVKEAASGGSLFSRERMQLEAYCSALGKILLAQLPSHDRDRYLKDGDLIPLTERTIVEPEILRAHLEGLAAAGYATDEEEVQAGLFCIAVPLALPSGMPPAAISLAGGALSPSCREEALVHLRRAAAELNVSLATQLHQPDSHSLESVANP